MHKNAVRAPQIINSFPAVESDFLLLSNGDGVLVPGSDETENRNE